MQRRAIVDWMKAVTLALTIVFLVQYFFFANYVVHGESMMPTIHDGNRLIVGKIDYEFEKPQRFDLIVFHFSKEEDFIKRIVGLPGETIAYKNDVLYVDGKPKKEPYLVPYKDKLETVSSGNLTKNFTLREMTGRKTVPNDCVFVMGDNRRHSYDSRYFGFVKMSDIVGKVDVKYWPVDAFQVY
ncbi:MAG TPA: signal peptidase I [Bacillales bacterium]|nr:signal peptidase I [Bacillales bacterium]